MTSLVGSSLLHPRRWLCLLPGHGSSHGLHGFQCHLKASAAFVSEAEGSTPSVVDINTRAAALQILIIIWSSFSMLPLGLSEEYVSRNSDPNENRGCNKSLVSST